MLRELYENRPQDCPILYQIHNTGVEVRKSSDVLGLCVGVSGNSMKFGASIC